MRVGVDFGGTKIEAALLDTGGAILARLRRPNPGNYAAAIGAVADLVAEVERAAGAKGKTIGLGMPGSLSPATGLVRNSNSTWLNGKPFLEDVTRALARPVRAANDANCFALSEAVDGAGAGAAIVFGIVLGTGCGGGVVIDQRAREGVNGIAGEWGHTPLPWPTVEESAGPRCWCGRPLCLEMWISGSGFARWGSERLIGPSGERLPAREIAARAAAGDPAASACLDLLYDRIARGLAVVMDILDPDAIVFGGGLSNIAGLAEGVRGKLAPYVFSDVIRTKLARNVHGDSSGVRGAAWLFTAAEAA